MRFRNIVRKVLGGSVLALTALPVIGGAEPKEANAAPSAACLVATSVSYTGDTILGTGCSTLFMNPGVTVSVAKANRLTVASPTIEVVGGGTAFLQANGMPGPPGAPGRDGDHYPEWKSERRYDYDQAKADAQVNPGNPCRGRQGHVGGTGGRSSDVFLPAGVVAKGTVKVFAQGGPPGPPGAGGRGTLLWNGEQRYCDGCEHRCENGPQGAQGPQGEHGSIFIGSTLQAKGALTLTSG
jgi:hypothetical protein